MKRPFPIFLPLLLSLIPLIFISSCIPADPPPYIDCDTQALVDAIDDANSDPDMTTIELFPGCEYLIDHENPGQVPYLQTFTALPVIHTEVIIEGNGATITRPSIIDQPHNYRYFAVELTGNLTLSNLTLANGELFCPHYDIENFNGGAIFNKGSLKILDAELRNNRGCLGGAILNDSSGVLEVTNTKFFENWAGNFGGAIKNYGESDINNSVFEFNKTGNTLLFLDKGGAISNDGHLMISNSHFYLNEAGLGGGAIQNLTSTGVITLSRCSIFGNRTTRGGASGISNHEGYVEIINSTVSNNRSESQTLSAIENTSGTLKISYSTIAFNYGGGAAVSSNNSDVSIANSILHSTGSFSNCSFPGSVLVLGNNLSTDSTCDGFNIIANPEFATMIDSSGLTWHYPLNPDSPAINQAVGDCPATDQRGVSRPLFMTCDLGAYESEEMDRCTIDYLVLSIQQANTDPDLTTIELSPDCSYLVDQPYAGNNTHLEEYTGLPFITTDISIVGNGASIFRPNLAVQPKKYRFFTVTNTGSLSLSDLTLEGGILHGTGSGYFSPWTSQGAAIYNEGSLEISDVLFRNNIANNGGALHNHPGSLMIINNSIFQQNRSFSTGGVIFNRGELEISASQFVDNQAISPVNLATGFGGAIDNTGQLTISSSFFRQNRAWRFGGAISNRSPEGVIDISSSLFLENQKQYPGSTLFNNEGQISILNTTFSGNGDYRSADAVIENEIGQVFISYCTFADNHTSWGAIKSDSIEVSINNCIFALNPYAGNCSASGPMNLSGSNLGSGFRCPGFDFNADPLLVDLADNGGGTMTYALEIDSPALNAASGECPTSDQRGEPRPQGSACDLGAYEYDGLQPTPSPTPEIDPCLFEALQNTNCRESDCPTADFVASLPMGESALLLGMNTKQTHGLFELSTGEECWMMMSLLIEGDVFACNPNIAVPPLCPSPVSDVGKPGSPTCRSDMNQTECEAAGGHWNTQGAIPKCDCP